MAGVPILLHHCEKGEAGLKPGVTAVAPFSPQSWSWDLDLGRRYAEVWECPDSPQVSGLAVLLPQWSSGEPPLAFGQGSRAGHIRTK